MHDDGFVREKAREIILSGKLPDRTPDRVWGGRGTGCDCAVCGTSIEYADMELEIEFDDAEGSGATSHFVHLHCFSILELERQKLSETMAAGRSRADGADAMAGR
jgi:hypothetical protein